jgi:hypothetical protein
MADKTKASLSTMTGSGVYYTTADGVKYNVRGLKIKWQEEYDEDKIFVSASEDKPVGFGQYWNISVKETKELVFKWFNRLVFNQSTGKPMSKEEFLELEYDDIGAILLKIMRLSD